MGSGLAQGEDTPRLRPRDYDSTFQLIYICWELRAIFRRLDSYHSKTPFFQVDPRIRIRMGHPTAQKIVATIVTEPADQLLERYSYPRSPATSTSSSCITPKRKY